MKRTHKILLSVDTVDDDPDFLNEVDDMVHDAFASLLANVHKCARSFADGDHPIDWEAEHVNANGDVDAARGWEA